MKTMKKAYIRPEIEVVGIEAQQMFASSNSIDIDSGQKGEESEDFALERDRGTWGNLWDESSNSR